MWKSRLRSIDAETEEDALTLYRNVSSNKTKNEERSRESKEYDTSFILMGCLLSERHPLPWKEIFEVLEQLKRDALNELIEIFRQHKHKHRNRDSFIWGDERSLFNSLEEKKKNEFNLSGWINTSSIRSLEERSSIITILRVRVPKDDGSAVES